MNSDKFPARAGLVLALVGFGLLLLPTYVQIESEMRSGIYTIAALLLILAFISAIIAAQ